MKILNLFLATNIDDVVQWIGRKKNDLTSFERKLYKGFRWLKVRNQVKK